MKSAKKTEAIAMIWTGIKFSVVALHKPLSPAMRAKVTTSRRYEFPYLFVNVYAIGYPCEEHRLAAVATSYYSAPDVMIDAIYN